MLSLVTPERLAEHLRDGTKVRVVDARWYMDGRSGRAAHAEGHIPGAVHLDVDEHLAGHDGPGRHPLPSPERWAAVRAGAGIDDDTLVVAYDDDGGSRAARVWFLLEHHGHPGGAALLDGGIDAWRGAGLPMEVGEVRPIEARKVVREGRRRVVDKRTVLAKAEARTGVILDARAGARFRGEVEPVDPRKGHVPSAKSAPYADNLTSPAGPFLDEDRLRARYAALGARPGADVVVYCGSGVTACHDLFVLDALGVEAALYEGSFSEWSRDDALPVETGDG